ncbi:MAG: MBL fold metallo-hydrolase, partial [Oligoflexales bacterium]|nr:MBL fold metallo-hydrolase [Oligoflexales bacterium]
TYIPKKDISKTRVDLKEIVPNVYMIKGAGGNIGVYMGSEGIVMVDSQFQQLSAKIEGAVQKIKKDKIRFLINTCWHEDHVGGNAYFSKDALIISHDAGRDRMAREQHVKFFDRKTVPLPPAGQPRLTFKDEMTIYMNEEEIKIIHADRAHSDGNSIVLFQKSKVAHIGDLYFAGGFPYIDIDNGGSVRGTIEALSKAAGLLPDDGKVIPGRGDVISKSELSSFLSDLKSITAYIEEEMKKDPDISKIIKKGLPQKWEKFGKSIISWDAFVRFAGASKT